MKLEFNVRENVSHLFPTLLGTFTYPDAEEIMPRIAEVVLGYEKKEGGVRRSNKGGRSHLGSW